LKFVFLSLLFLASAILAYFHRVIFQHLKNRAASYRRFVEAIIRNSAAAVKKSAIVRIEAVTAVVSAALCALSGIWLLIIPAVLIMFFIPKIYISIERKRYIAQYRAGLQGFLEQVISSLRAGTSISRALQDYCAGDNSPVAREISFVLKKTGFGSAMKEALEDLNRRVPVRENEILTAALSTALETGGNLSDVLSTILATIRQREALLRDVKALTSQGLLSGLIVGALPFLLAGVMLLMDPELMLPLFTTREGALMIAAAVIMEATGGFIIFKIVDIKG
jgi:tight adherence protein B